MGININLVRLLGNEDDHGFPRFVTESIEWFDWIRYVGDRQFHRYLLCENCNIISENDGVEYPDLGAITLIRPADIDNAERWVSTTEAVPDCNKPRLLKALGAMRNDDGLWFYVS